MLKKFCSFYYTDVDGNRSQRNVYLLNIDYQDDGEVPPHLSLLAYDFERNSIRRFKALNCFNLGDADMEKISSIAALNLSYVSNAFEGSFNHPRILYKEKDKFKVKETFDARFVVKAAEDSDDIKIIGVF